jgi:hypothetical protein
MCKSWRSIWKMVGCGRPSCVRVCWRLTTSKFFIFTFICFVCALIMGLEVIACSWRIINGECKEHERNKGTLELRCSKNEGELFLHFKNISLIVLWLECQDPSWKLMYKSLHISHFRL